MAAMANHTVGMEFYLTPFSEAHELQLAHGFLFLLIYLVALVGNLLIIVLVTVDQCLHTPMYFFLKNLSLLDACLVSVTVPNFIFAGAELFTLMAMSYDRYVAICHPLHCDVIMNRGVCVWMVAVSWFLGGIFGVLYSAGTFSLSLCGSRKLPQFFCDVPSLLKISCSKSHVTIDASVVFGVIYALFCVVSIGFSYVCIFKTVTRMPSSQGRSRAFSTCTPHLIVVTTFFVTGVTAYLKPVPESPHPVDFLVSVLYSVMPPSLNPVIYSLRNKDVKASLWKILWKLCHKYYGGKL
ncbi:olfactory receptor 14K1-like [Marmota flaviventris]|uniref:olfactory receptor 14K1-like n=1 Tax=Marmota flaviventris TaxID=93162 RepID=UPI003A8BF34B